MMRTFCCDRAEARAKQSATVVLPSFGNADVIATTWFLVLVFPYTIEVRATRKLSVNADI